MWETSFWTVMLDEMERHWYNLLSLWSPHPFPSIVRVPEYPNVAQADVKKKSGALWNATGTGLGMYDTSWTLTTLKSMLMDETQWPSAGALNPCQQPSPNVTIKPTYRKSALKA